MAPLVALAGFMGSGKSSVGALSARLLGWRFVDLDDEIVKSAGMTIAEFFERHGEADFRRREVEVLRGDSGDGGTRGPRASCSLWVAAPCKALRRPGC